MALRQRYLVGLALVCALLCAIPARALASAGEESTLMDDQLFIYDGARTMAWAMQEAKFLGVDRIKVSVVWSIVAPDPNSTTKPNFDATNPNAYPYGAWTRYDEIVAYAHELGMKVYFQIAPPAPAWAVGRGQPTQGYPWSYRPSVADYQQFVEAVGRRYSGSFVPTYSSDAARARAQKDLTFPIPLPGSQSQPAPPPPALPGVNYWGLWNEPNEGAWLNPQFRYTGRGRHRAAHDIAPSTYRHLINAGYDALAATGHARDTILIGEIASHGWVYPVQFVRDLFCLNPRDRPLTGRAAKLVGCPGSGNRARFVLDDPGLFKVSGFAHHPYGYDHPPSQVGRDPNIITLANLGALEHTLNRAYATYGRPWRGGVPIYLTEFGYKTNPPNPFVHTTLTDQATWLDQGDYMTWRSPYVRSLTQFLLIDTPPRAGAKPGSLAYWSTSQTGLFYDNGQIKPSFLAFLLPLWLPHPHHGRHVAVWAQLRGADHTRAQYAVLQFSRNGTDWGNLAVLSTTSPEGYVSTHVAIRSAGFVRVAWLDPGNGDLYYSRVVPVS